MFTVKQLEEALSQWEEEVNLSYGTFLALWYEDLEHDLPNLEGIGQVESVESWGGEGDGAAIHVVIKVGDRYFQQDGYYSSWGESEMDGQVVEVKPVQVMRTEYQEI